MKKNILLLTINKTASQSIYRSIRNGVSESDTVHHSHYMSTDLYDAIYNPNLLTGKELANQKRWALKEAKIYKSLANPRDMHYVITVVREPISRLYSAIFYKHSKELTDYFEDRSLLTKKEIYQKINKHAEFQYEKQKNWYRKELGALSLNIMDISCPENGYSQIIKEGRVFGVFLFEKLSSGWSEFLKKNSLDEKTKLIKMNRAVDVGVLTSYEKLKTEFPLKPELIDEFYRLTETKHFYGKKH